MMYLVDRLGIRMSDDEPFKKETPLAGQEVVRLSSMLHLGLSEV